jgi:hypothetical protein
MVELRICGVGRDPETKRAIVVVLDRGPTDDELRDLHEHLRAWNRRAPASAAPQGVERIALSVVQGDVAHRWRNGECGDGTLADAFAAAIAAHVAREVEKEREACASLAADHVRFVYEDASPKAIAAAIRSRKDEPSEDRRSR